MLVKSSQLQINFKSTFTEKCNCENCENLNFARCKDSATNLENLLDVVF